jgi:hypothetical protein
MNRNPESGLRHGNALLAIAVGGFIAGAIDLTWACIEEGWWDIPLVVAGGILGRQAIHGGVATWILGVLLHFLNAFVFATFYYVASRKLIFLKEHWIICGLAYGAAVELVMNLIVLPLSALHAMGPFTLHYLLEGLIGKMIVVGLPISLSVRRFSPA